MTIKTDRLFCASCKSEILDKKDVAARKDEIVHQTCKNEWVKFQKKTKEILSSGFSGDDAFLEQTFENATVEQIAGELGYQLGYEPFTAAPGVVFPRSDNTMSITLTRQVSRRIGNNEILFVKVGETKFKTRLLSKTNSENDTVDCVLEILERIENEHNTFSQRFEFNYPDDFNSNGVARFTFGRSTSFLLVKQLKAQFVSQDLDSLEFEICNAIPSSVFHHAYLTSDDATIRPFIPPRLISDVLKLKIIDGQNLRSFGLFLTFEVITE